MTPITLDPERTEAGAEPVPTAPPRRRRRERIARAERPLLLAGLALVTLHLLDLAFSGPDTSALGVAVILTVAAAWVLAAPHVTRPTRLALGVVAGLVAFGFGVISHGLHVVNSGPDWRDVTGVGYIFGGLLLVAAGLAATAAPRRAPRRSGLGRRAAHAAGWIAGAAIIAQLAVLPFVAANQITHAPRWAIDESALGIAHQEIRIEMRDGRKLAAWYVPSRNGAAVLLSHGSGGSRGRIPAHVRMLARHGYGVLALDNPGNGESDGHSNGLGDNAQPAIAAGLDYLARRPDVDPDRIAGFGLSLGGEVLLEAAAHDRRFAAVVSDGATRPMDGDKANPKGTLEAALGWLTLRSVRATSGMKTSSSLIPMMPRIAPRPVLLVAGGGFPDEIPASRLYREAGGSTVELWELPDTGHTAGLRKHPAAYERRTVGFLDRALGSQ
ncbi:MAG TPA: alpha/beta fold hydrolase [Baekduia sp.]|nr:alpha/beta fold hydrolase [Baekduia sp.]